MSNINQFKIVEDTKEWQKLLNKALFKTFFHNLEWEEFLEKNFQWLKFKRYLYKDEALLSFASSKIFGKEKLISHPFCEYGGHLPLKSEIDGMEFKRELFLSFKTPLKISFHPQIPKFFKNLGLKEVDSTRDAYFIENIQQKNENEIFSSFRKTLRHLLKKTEEQNFEIRQCQNEEELKIFYGLYIKNAKKQKTIPYLYSFLKYFLASPMAEIILAAFKGKIIAGSVFLKYENIIHYFLNASDEKYKNFGVNHLILWTQIKNYLGKNYQIFDLGGTRRGSSLEIFKTGWGAQRYPIFELKNYSEDKLKESKLRNILGILPIFSIKKLTPYLLKYKL